MTASQRELADKEIQLDKEVSVLFSPNRISVENQRVAYDDAQRLTETQSEYYRSAAQVAKLNKT